MGSRLLNGSFQFSVMVILFPLILTVLSSTVTLGTIAGTSVKCSSIYLNTQLQHARYPDDVIMLVLMYLACNLQNDNLLCTSGKYT